MKTAISIPDKIFKQADSLARRLKVSRSALYRRAIEEYLQKRDGAEITRQLNSVYNECPSELDPVLNEMQLRSLPKEDW